MVEQNINALLANWLIAQQRGNQIIMNTLDALMQQNDTLQKAYDNVIKELNKDKKMDKKSK